MSAVLEVSRSAVNGRSIGSSLYRFTVKDYYRMLEAGILTEDDRVELIRGEISKQTFTAEQRFNLATFPEVSVEVNALLPRPGKAGNHRKKK